MRSLTLRLQRKATVDDRSGTSLLTQGLEEPPIRRYNATYSGPHAFRATYTAVKVRSFKPTPSLDLGDKEDRSS